MTLFLRSQQALVKMSRALPWIAATGLCALLIGGIGAAVLPRGESVKAERSNGTSERQKTSETPERRLLSTLPLVPPSAREAVLVAAVMENHVDARPYQRGLADAEVVFEMIAEGDITRFLVLFRGDQLPETLGPIRSLRPHAVNVLQPYDTLLLHIGGSALAYEALTTAPRIQNHDGIRYDGKTYARDKEIAPPHNLFIGEEMIEGVLERTEMPKTAFPLFLRGRGTPEGDRAEDIRVDLGSKEHNVTFQYEPLGQAYRRSLAGAVKQAEPEAVLILETEVQGYGERGTVPWTRTFGKGNMLLFARGKRVAGTWHREREAPFTFVDEEGAPMTLPHGQLWIMLLPSLRQVTSLP